MPFLRRDLDEILKSVEYSPPGLAEQFLIDGNPYVQLRNIEELGEVADGGLQVKVVFYGIRKRINLLRRAEVVVQLVDSELKDFFKILLCVHERNADKRGIYK